MLCLTYASCREFDTSDAEDGSLLNNFGQLFRSTPVSLSTSQQYLLLLEADNNGTTNGLYTLRNSGVGTTGLPGVRLREALRGLQDPCKSAYAPQLHIHNFDRYMPTQLSDRE